MASGGDRDGKAEQGVGKAARERNAVSQSWAATSILPDLPLLG